ncbi:Potassium-transporting ATPase KdpC subunit [compost metagenome]
MASGASNLAPSNPALVERINTAADRLASEGHGKVPMALVTTSGSSLDPHLPPAAARFQIPRIAAERGLPEASLERLVEQNTERPLVGPAVVNVLALNTQLNEMAR